MDFILWLVVAGIMIILEMISLGLTTIWFAIGAIATALVAYLGAGWFIQIIVFAAISLLMLFITRPIVQKHLMKNVPTNIDSLIGKRVIVLSDVNGELGVGKVSINGLEWSAIAEGNEQLKKDEEAIVKAIEGNKVIISKI